jgi:predicted nucleotidyltransferase
MPSNLTDLVSRGLAHPPSGYDELIQYEVWMGSAAYGVSNDSSDLDVYGFLIPPKGVIFPHLNGEIDGFGPRGPRFEVYQQHHITDTSAKGGQGRVWDYQIYNIVKYFDLVMNNNPNMIDSLFVPERCIQFMTPIGQMVRENRHMFLNKKCWHTFKGYAYQQLHKLRIKNPSEESKRYESIVKYGYDVKFAYHVVRLLNEVEMLMIEGDLDLERSREQLKSIRRGDWKLEEIEDYFKKKESELETVYTESKLPHKPDVARVKQLLLNCLEQHFGSLTDCVARDDTAGQAIKDIKAIIAQAGF